MSDTDQRKWEYRAARMMDQGLTQEEIARKTGRTPAEIAELAARTRPRPRAEPDEPTAAELVVMRHMYNLMRKPDARPWVTTEDVMESCGAETAQEIEQYMVSLRSKGLLDDIQVVPPQGAESDEAGARILHPDQWTGPESRLGKKLRDDLSRARTASGGIDENDEQQMKKGTILASIYSMDTVRIPMDSSTLTRIATTATEGMRSPGPGEARWPFEETIYIELSEPLGQGPDSPEGELQAVIIPRGPAPRMMITATTRDEVLETRMMGLDLDTWEVTGPDGEPSEAPEEIKRIIAGIAGHLSSRGNMIVARTLTRAERRRAAQRGLINAWLEVTPIGDEP